MNQNCLDYASCKKSLQIQLKKSLQATKKLLGQPKKKRQKGYTAYMLWCGVQRARVVAQNPGIDFAQISKRLGDMWQTVPEKEKMTWRRKARKMAKKGSSFINTGRPRIAPIETILIPEQQQQQQPLSKMVYHGKLPKHKEKSLVEDHSPVHSKVNNCLPVYNETVTGSDPMDVAAHLKLLGESLTVIGARLQEHKGQIAVQGSMSVLLDSLVCTLGSLLCLTSQVPELNGCPDEIHRRTLDNIAYIMPGVG